MVGAFSVHSSDIVGTYPFISGSIKKGNRHSEILLRDVEVLLSTHPLL